MILLTEGNQSFGDMATRSVYELMILILKLISIKFQ